MSGPHSSGPDTTEARAGVAFALGAFLFWGLAPLYFKTVVAVPALELLAHRVLWSMLLLAGLLIALGRLRPVLLQLSIPGVLPRLLASTTLISVNWLVFIWAVGQARVLEISLGYYINPLVNVLLGMLVLRERLSPATSVAVLLAAAGVMNLAWQADGLPWVSLALAFSFGVYGLVRKLTPLGPIDGLMMETALVAPLAIGFLIWTGWDGGGVIANGQVSFLLLLAAAGPVTAIPLIWYAAGARRLRYTTIGFLQYLAPTCHFLIAVLVFGEPFDTAQLVTFACIWAAVAIFTADGVMRSRRTGAVRESGR
ncbi:EamA family transporter RarD [Algihabitans albus]|uniref:EamA family transporter RarD n=1 Tax=Algihabitans albus TaxID=2164067 RepID=UPI001ABD28B1|nr:EamA family transporter RarD [Algihabitans albus]